MDEYLKPIIQGITAPDKPLKEMQDSVLHVLGPLCTVYENHLSMDSAVATDGVVQLDSLSVHNFLECIKHALLLLGHVAAQISTNRRELVLAKINPLMVSLAQEEFSDSKRDLFGSSFEQRLKTRSETAETISKATRVAKPFFRGGASREFHRPRGGQQGFRFKLFRTPYPRGNVSPTRVVYRGRARAQHQSPRFTRPQTYRPYQP